MISALLFKWEECSPRTKEILVALAIPAFLLLLLLAGEVLLRGAQWKTYGAIPAIEIRRVAEIWESIDGRQRPRPGSRWGSLVFSEDGFRGLALRKPKPEGVIRLGFFGSSTTLNRHIRNDGDTWPHVVVDLLQKSFPRCRFDFFNAGISGDRISFFTRRLLEDAARFSPDLAVLLPSDLVFRAREQARKAGFPFKGYQPSAFARASLLWLKLEKNATALYLQRQATRERGAFQMDFRSLLGDMETDLKQFVETARSVDALPVFVEQAPRARREQSVSAQMAIIHSRLLYLPGVPRSDIVEGPYVYNQAIDQTSKAQAVPRIATLDLIRSDHRYYTDSIHMTKEGNRLFGELVARQMAESAQVRDLIAQRGGGCLEGSP
ncbi:SGNH/GDSL hydrolase family protein [Magnetospira sp. QH-2]|uniref:SGNH/GDSL hydrolase family protein n=1 Tax=Magnetospira sp. (strain QH-2) TaxID=1288970 RepID=UPI0003E81957|nr:SGNH/GDSL hydrolase family protein [Magnetospira sp. QH-2]CCQ73608.1 Protein of unknown function [Magnetospira sp. QH-2]